MTDTLLYPHVSYIIIKVRHLFKTSSFSTNFHFSFEPFFQHDYEVKEKYLLQREKPESGDNVPGGLPKVP